MRRGWVAVALALVVSAASTGDLAARQSRPQDVAYETAFRTETIDADLSGAIKQYEAIVAKYRTEDRAVAAKALLRLAECHRKLRKATARSLFEQVVKEFADQKEAVQQARSRLAAAEPAARDAERRVGTIPVDAVISGNVSADGRLVGYVDWSDAGKANLIVRTLATGADRRVTDTGNEPGTRWLRRVNRFAFSRDGRQVAYSWDDNGTRRSQIRVASLTATTGEPRVLVDVEAPSWIDPYDWTADGQWIAAIWRIDGDAREIGVVSTRDGSRRPLKTITQPCACEFSMSLSPDGKYLAFDMPGSQTVTRDIFAIETASGREIHAVAYASHDALIGWSPDGRSIVFASDRAGSMGLWLVPFTNGQPGEQRAIRAEMGPFVPRGITSHGSLFFCRCESQGGSDVKIAEFDFSAGRFLSPPTDAVQEFIGTNSQPFWSTDGKWFMYRSLRRNQDPLFVVRSTTTREIREIRPGFREIWDARWAPDDRSFAVLTLDFEGQWAFHRIDAQSGAATPMVRRTSSGGNFGVISTDGARSWSPDGSKFYFRNLEAKTDFSFIELDVTSGTTRTLVQLPGVAEAPRVLDPAGRVLYYRAPVPGTADFSIKAHDLATGAERELLRAPWIGALNLSPDGRLLAVARMRTSDAPGMIVLVPVDGQPMVELFRATAGDAGAAALLPRGQSTWARDSRSMIVRFAPEGGRPEFWWVSLDGRPARKLPEFDGLDPSNIHVHPDGKRLLFGARPAGRPETQPTELLRWENMLPAKIGR